MKMPGNCLFCVLLAWAKSPRSVRLRVCRNRYGRLHCYWEAGGVPYEFYAKGRSRKGYLANALYLGETKVMAKRPNA